MARKIKVSLAEWMVNNLGEDAIEKYWSEKNEVSPWDISYGSKTKVWVNCREKDYHGSYYIRSNDFTTRKRCPYCAGRKTHPKDSLGVLKPKSNIIWSDKNKKSPFEYTPKSHQELMWKCEKGIHDDYKRSIDSSNKCDFRCPDCVQEKGESFLQEKVRLFLSEELSLPLFHERNCSLKCINPSTNYPLPYDNEVSINNNKLIIEVHGIQHYEVTNFTQLEAKKNNATVEFELAYLQWKDKHKRNYALSHGYFYLEIPYWTDNEQEDWKSLIIHKLNEINHFKIKEEI